MTIGTQFAASPYSPSSKLEKYAFRLVPVGNFVLRSCFRNSSRSCFRNKSLNWRRLKLACGILVFRTRVASPHRIRTEGLPNDQKLEERGEPSRLGGMLHKRQLARQAAKMLVIVGQPAIGKSRPGERHADVQLGPGEQSIGSEP